MGTFELIAASEEPGSIGLPEQGGLGNDVLLHNARWFTKLRWIAVSAVILAGLAGTFAPAFFRGIGLVPPVRWPWILAAVLVAANCLFTILAGRLRDDSSQSAIKATIWLQIVIDLIVLTVLVHIVGSTTTFVSFAFLFHIALACIFFPPRESLLVAVLASGLFGACVVLETFEIVHAGGMVAHAPSVPHSGRLLNLAFAGTAVFIWFIVWYLVSALSEAVRRRDRQLRAANERLMKADQEKTLQVLRTTHELKAPFSGIESNIQILKLQHWNEIPESVRGIVERIEHPATLGPGYEIKAKDHCDVPIAYEGTFHSTHDTGSIGTWTREGTVRFEAVEGLRCDVPWIEYCYEAVSAEITLTVSEYVLPGTPTCTVRPHGPIHFRLPDDDPPIDGFLGIVDRSQDPKDDVYEVGLSSAGHLPSIQATETCDNGETWEVGIWPGNNWLLAPGVYGRTGWLLTGSYHAASSSPEFGDATYDEEWEFTPIFDEA